MLAHVMGQEEYIFDITTHAFFTDDIENAVIKRLKNWPLEEEMIKERDAEAQKSSSLSALRNYL